jgi:hypothetical protein
VAQQLATIGFGATLAVGTVYQAPSIPIWVMVFVTGTGTVTAYDGPSSPPISYEVGLVSTLTTEIKELIFPVPANWYYEIAQTSGTNTVSYASTAK